MRATTRTAATIVRPGASAIDALSSTNGLTTIGWHGVDRVGGGLTTSLTDFRRQLDTLAEWHANVLPLSTAVRLLATNQLPERAVALTFDDGYANVVEKAWPILRSRGLPATLFVVSGYLRNHERFPWDRRCSAGDDRVRTIDERALREASDAGLDVGSHTVSHRWLPSLGADEVDRELTGSRRDLEDLLGRRVCSFAYPMGGWNPAVRDRVAAAGYELAVTVDRGRSRPGHDPLALRREIAFPRSGDFRMQLRGAFTWMRPVERWLDRRRRPRW